MSPTLSAAMASHIILILSAFVFTTVTAQDCSYVLPEYQNDHACLEFDLAPLADSGSYNVTQIGADGYNYMVKVSPSSIIHILFGFNRFVAQQMLVNYLMLVLGSH